MGDPREGLTPDGSIRTGAHVSRIAASYRPILDRALELVAGDDDVAVLLYGSVATGEARMPASDVDLLTIGLDADRAAGIARQLSHDYVRMCRSVDIADAMPHDFEGDVDEAYGNRVFLHHYCVRLAGPDHDRADSGFPGDRKAARGFNGDIARHLARWREEQPVADPAVLGRKVARKTLLAVAGLVSVHDATWTTDRSIAAQRWAEVDPELHDGLATLLDWSSARSAADASTLAGQLDHTVEPVVAWFAADIGLWPD